MSTAIERARQDWEEGYRRFLEETRDRARGDELYRQVDVVSDRLRRHVGSSFTLAELAAAYADAERWVRAALEEEAAPGWPATLTVVQDAAFRLYSRSAADYAP